LLRRAGASVEDMSREDEECGINVATCHIEQDRYDRQHASSITYDATMAHSE
jgi:hypothetical protein